MTTPNYYDLTGDSIRIGYYPKGAGGPIRPGGGEGPTLVYTDQSGNTQAFSGSSLTALAVPGMGQLVSAIVKKTDIVPGAVVSIGVLIPDVEIGSTGAGVSVKTFANTAIHRGTSQLGPGQLETYSVLTLTGTAANVIQPDAAKADELT